MNQFNNFKERDRNNKELLDKDNKNKEKNKGNKT